MTVSSPSISSATDDVVLPLHTSLAKLGHRAAFASQSRRRRLQRRDLSNTIVPELTGRIVPPGDATALAYAMREDWNAQPADIQGAFEQVKKRLSWSEWANRLMQPAG